MFHSIRHDFSPLPQPPKEKWFIKRKRETVYYLSMEVLRNLCTQIDSSPTHIYVKAAVPFLCAVENFSGFHLQEKAQRFISNMSDGRNSSDPAVKVIKNE